MPARLHPTLHDALKGASAPLAGMWICSGSPVIAEICGGSGLDWVLIDMEHSTNSLESVQVQLQVLAAYDIVPVVRVPSLDAVMLKRVLDAGAQSVLVPMVSSAEDARAAVRAVRYPPEGIRGVGSALSRSARWNRVDGYLAEAAERVSLFVQVESVEGAAEAFDIASVDGVDGVFVGPSDLAASMGLLGEQTHPDVVAAVLGVFTEVRRAGKPVGVNAFAPDQTRAYREAGASFVLHGADVALLARQSEALAAEWGAGAREDRASY